LLISWVVSWDPLHIPHGIPFSRGDHSLLYFAYTCVRDLFIGGGVIYLAKKIIRWWYFTCIKPENIICDGILHVNMFHYFKIPYFMCNVFTKFTYNEYIGPYFLSHVVLRFLPSDLPETFLNCPKKFPYSPGQHYPYLPCGIPCRF